MKTCLVSTLCVGGLVASLGGAHARGAGPPPSAELARVAVSAALLASCGLLLEDEPTDAVSREVAVGFTVVDEPNTDAVSREVAVRYAEPVGPLDNAWSREIAVGQKEQLGPDDNGWSREIVVSWDPDKPTFATSREISVGGYATLSGTIVFGDIDPGLAPTGGTLIVRSPDGSEYGTYPLNLVNGAFSVANLPRMWLTVSFKESHWLRRTMPVNLGAGDVTGFQISLVNGDIDDDNAVTVFDYTLLSDAFDTMPGDLGWNAMADLDGDEAITVFDYTILSDNFDKNGDD